MSSTDGPAPMVLTEDQAFELLAFLFSAAEISLIEPTYYGTFRLVDAASRLIGFMLEHDPEHRREFLHASRTRSTREGLDDVGPTRPTTTSCAPHPAVVAAEMKRIDETARSTTAKDATP